jgi:hypothetical protein
VKKFYFLDYFYILLKSVEQYSLQTEIFEEFKILKKKYLLGESKYKKLTIEEDDDLKKKQLDRFRYTFQQVISESIDYNLIEKRSTSFNKLRENMTQKEKQDEEDKKLIYLTEIGKKTLDTYNLGRMNFNFFMLQIMEKKHNSFYQLIKLCYGDNTLKNGLLIFPIYSGLKLNFEKSSFTTNKHVFDYSKALTNQLETDIKRYTNKRVTLQPEEDTLIKKLIIDGILGEKTNETFNSKYYNAILGRFRKYWLNYFLKNIYNYPYSFDIFNIWVERAKQVGVLHTTEFFPDFSGRIIYPTSIIVQETNNPDFMKGFKYLTDEILYIHKPLWDNNQDGFVKTLLDEYYILQKTRKTHFINLSDLKERVCFKLRIPNFVFDDFLEKVYMLNLQGKLTIQISLEADKLPHETNAMYLKREPVLVGGKLKNIIAINYR